MKKLLIIFAAVLGFSLFGGIAFAAPETSGLVFDRVFTSGGKTFYTDIKPQTSVKLTDGTYDLRVLVGFYGSLSDMNGTEFSNAVKTGYSVSYKKEGTSQYLSQIAVDSSTSDITIPNYTGEAYTALHSTFKTSQTVDPGRYVVDVIYASKIIDTVEICLPTFTSSAGNSKGNETCGATSVDLVAGDQDPSTTNPGTYDKKFDITPNNSLATSTSVVLRVMNSNNQLVSDTPVTLPAGTLTTSPTVEELAVGNYTAAVYQGALKISATVVFKISASSTPQTTTFTIASTGQASAGNNTYIKTLEIKPSNALTTALPVEIHYGADVPDDGSLPNGTVSDSFTIPVGSAGGEFDTVALDPGDYDAAVFVGNTRISNKITFTVAGTASVNQLFTITLQSPSTKNASGKYDIAFDITPKDNSFANKTFSVKNGGRLLNWPTDSGIESEDYKASFLDDNYITYEFDESCLCKIAVYDGATLVSNELDFAVGYDQPVKDDETKDTNDKVTKDGKLKSPLGEKYDTIEEIIVALMNNLVIPIAVPVVIIAIIYTGWLFIAARGNAEKLKQAKQAALYTAIGAAVVLGAWVIASAIKGTIEEIRGTARVEQVETIKKV